MSTLQAFILGAVQGLTEFLPISSSGHLLVIEKLMGISSESGSLLTLNILLHFGTLVAVFAVYWRRIWNMICHPIKSELKWLIVATIPAVVAALVVDFDAAFEGKFIIWSFYLTSVVLVAGTTINKHRRRNHSLHKNVRWYDAVSMGVMQAVAILPGLSRSGSTISGGVASGLSRKRAADFAFLMSIPAILGSAVLDLKDVLFDGAGGSIELLPTVVGVFAAAAFGLIAIKGFLALIRKVSMNVFAAYTFLLGTVLLLNKYVFHWIELL
ncbi:MAG: undecaprenyl-diphosphate phosphatase [Aristaeellaceae bacterium]